MKANTSPDLIADFYARGGVVSVLKSRINPPKGDCLRSGNHIHLPKRIEARPIVTHPRPVKVLRPAHEDMAKLTNVELVGLFNTLAEAVSAPPMPAHMAKKSKSTITAAIDGLFRVAA